MLNARGSLEANQFSGGPEFYSLQWLCDFFICYENYSIKAYYRLKLMKVLFTIDVSY